jgi:hypothetical protein
MLHRLGARELSTQADGWRVACGRVNGSERAADAGAFLFLDACDAGPTRHLCGHGQQWRDLRCGLGGTLFGYSNRALPGPIE